MKILKRIISLPIIFVINFYRYFISPIFPSTCRYNPTCSAYFKESVEVWGPIKGTKLGLKRISRCHPWGAFGEDPVPKK
jgi:putative membrane protein insertion efficiency factor